MKIARAVFTALVFLAGNVCGTSYLGSIVGSFNATATVGAFRYYPLGLAFEGTYVWTGHSKYVAKWTTTGSRANMHYLNDGITYDTAYDRNNGTLYGINRLSSTYRVVAVDPSSGSITSSFVVPAPFTVPQGLTFANGYLYIADMYQSRILKTTTTGSVVNSINPGVFAIKGLAWDADTTGGPFLFACEMDTAHTIHKINPSTGSVLSSFAGPTFTGNIIGLAWDGTYLWACQNYAGQNMYAFQFIAHDPNTGIAPASFGSIKALYR